MLWYQKYTLIPPTTIQPAYVDWYENKSFYFKHGPGRMWIDGSEQWFTHETSNSLLHREDGPAEISKGFCKYTNELYEKWYLYNEDITEQVEEWIKEHNYPCWSEWDDTIKLHFKLTFI